MGDPQAALCSGASLVDTCSVVVAWMRWPQSPSAGCCWVVDHLLGDAGQPGKAQRPVTDR
jgi:hypothetical protein